MFDDLKDTPEEHQEAALSPEEIDEGIVPEASERPEEPAAPEPESELDRVRREAKENYDKYLRVYAEFENYRKRMEREKADVVKYANEGLIRDILIVLDNLERALSQAHGHAGNESFVQGVEMIFKQFKDILEKYGVREIQALGEPFDPNLHEAMMHEVADEHEENTVIDELQRGYVLKDRLLRPAMVRVSKKSAGKVDVDAGSQDNH